MLKTGRPIHSLVIRHKRHCDKDQSKATGKVKGEDGVLEVVLHPLSRCRAFGRQWRSRACALAGYLAFVPIVRSALRLPSLGGLSVYWETGVTVVMTAVGFLRTLNLHASGRVRTDVNPGKWKVEKSLRIVCSVQIS